MTSEEIHKRWKRLLVGVLVALGGLLWLRVRFGGGDAAWEATRIGGVILAAAFAYGAMQRDSRVKWPAAVALVCVSPISRDAVSVVTHIEMFAGHPSLGIPVIVVVAGAATAVIAAVRILVSKSLPVVEPPIAVARVVDEDAQR